MRRIAAAVELALSVALFGAILLAAWRFVPVLDRLDAGPLAGAGFALVFAGAAALAGRRALAIARRLKRNGNEDDAISRKR